MAAIYGVGASDGAAEAATGEPPAAGERLEQPVLKQAPPGWGDGAAQLEVTDGGQQQQAVAAGTEDQPPQQPQQPPRPMVRVAPSTQRAAQAPAAILVQAVAAPGLQPLQQLGEELLGGGGEPGASLPSYSLEYAAAPTAADAVAGPGRHHPAAGGGGAGGRAEFRPGVSPVDVFVGGLPPTAQDFDVFLALANAGEVLAVKVFRRARGKGECRGYGKWLDGRNLCV